MKQRAITAVWLMAILIPLVILGGVYFLVLGIILTMFAAYEMMNMFYKQSPTLKYYRYIVPFFVGILVLMIYFSTTKGLNPSLFNLKLVGDKLELIDGTISNESVISGLLWHFWVMTVFIVSVVICLGSMIFVKHTQSHDMMACITTLCYCGLLMGYTISIRFITPIAITNIFDNKLFGGRAFVYLYSIVISTDLFAYLIGIKWGKRKLCPEISPKKSIEGAIAGLVAGGIIGVGVFYIFDFIKFADTVSTGTIILVTACIFVLSIILSVAVQLGDLIASKFKRSYGIKDYSNIFPGHGGVLDRFDSLIFSGAVLYVILQFIQLVILGAA